jgi:putative hydrolase
MNATLLPPVDYHIHTVYSGHSKEDATVGQIIRRAERIGLEEIAFLEHFDAPEHEGALDAIREETAAARPKLRVLVGAECALAADDPPRLKAVPRSADLIGFSVHHFPTTKVPWFENKAKFSRAERLRVLDAWIRSVESVIENFRVDLCCHPFFAMPLSGAIDNYRGDFAERVDGIFERMAARAVAFEINNTMPLKVGGGMLAGYTDVVARARSVGVKFAVGSDAHSLDQVGSRQWIDQTAAQAGLAAEDFVRFGKER